MHQMFVQNVRPILIDLLLPNKYPEGVMKDLTNNLMNLAAECAE